MILWCMHFGPTLKQQSLPCQRMTIKSRYTLKMDCHFLRKDHFQQNIRQDHYNLSTKQSLK